MALIDELKERADRLDAEMLALSGRIKEIERESDAVHICINALDIAEMDEKDAADADLDRAIKSTIAALEAPAQPVHPEAELRSVPGAEEEVRDQLCTCHPDDAPPECQHKYAASECRAAWDAAIRECTRWDVRDEPTSLIDVQTCEEVDPRCSWKAEPEIPEGFTKWEGGEWTGDPLDLVQVIFHDEPTPYVVVYADELKPLWNWSECPPDAQRIIAYQLVSARAEQSAPAPEQDASVEIEPNPAYAEAVSKGAITQDEADFLISERERIAADEQAKFFAEGMMADADRHAQERSMMEKAGEALAAIFKREREDA